MVTTSGRATVTFANGEPLTTSTRAIRSVRFFAQSDRERDMWNEIVASNPKGDAVVVRKGGDGKPVSLDFLIGDTPAEPAVIQPASTTARTAKGKGSEPSEGTPRRRKTARRARENTGSDGKAQQHRAKARTGRPPGIRSPNGRAKDKTSLALDLELMDGYRKQSWKEECQLGELIERALREYAQQHWNWKQSI